MKGFYYVLSGDGYPSACLAKKMPCAGAVFFLTFVIDIGFFFFHRHFLFRYVEGMTKSIGYIEIEGTGATLKDIREVN